MSDNDNRDPADALPPPQVPSATPPDDGGEDDGPDEPATPPAGGSPTAASPAEAPGALGGGRRRRRRRRRGRGAPVLFTADGQAYRMAAGPDGQQTQVFLSPAELAAHQARSTQGGPPGVAGGGQRPPPQVHAPQGLVSVEGVLDTEAKGPNAFLRQVKRSLLAGPEDAEFPKNLVQKLRLRPGQFIQAQAQMRGPKGVVQRVDTVDGLSLEAAARLPHFSDLTSIDPVERIKLEHGHREMVTRVLDLIAPLGKGQRALIVAPPKTGKTIMLQRIAQAVITNHPEVHVMVLLIDERPEEVTDMRRSIKGEVLASNADRPTGDHLKVAELAMERARRMVEAGRDVMVLLDSITRLARAYNKEVDSSGRTLTGGVDSRALERPKRLFGAARATEEAGSLTIVGTALIDTGSRMDEVIFEEFKGTGNSEITLDRMLAEKRIFPAINIPQSGTRKEEKLFTQKEYEKVKKLRQMLFAVKPVEAMEALVKRLSRSTYNDEFLEEL
jgi:transcription termination factor Rho